MLISFRIDWFEILAVQGTQESFPAQQFEIINSSALSLLYGPAFMVQPQSNHEKGIRQTQIETQSTEY